MLDKRSRNVFLLFSIHLNGKTSKERTMDLAQGCRLPEFVAVSRVQVEKEVHADTRGLARSSDGCHPTTGPSPSCGRPITNDINLE
jgi:hypothetical protein